MKFIADFHVHSKFSRATAQDLDLENLYIAARLKGITVVGTGDFTHPAWFSEISEKLVPAEDGLFKLREDIAKACDTQVPKTCHRGVRFMLVSEISNIYKKYNKTRKNHNLVFVPNLDIAEKFISRLDKIGNIQSDGRPILGLDAHTLLEIVLDISEQNYLVPAHIWTPWFSLLGSKSGFDSITECFEDLTPHIFAVETGLSSDPSMNWRVSGLDGLTLISNSDAHSPLKLGREANLFNTELGYSKIKQAMKSSNSREFLGTFEFYPEEGKYHLDGHRKCNVRLWPKETIKNKGNCPICGKALTLGVLYRVDELADREQGFKPENSHPYFSIIPLVEILSEILRVGPGSKKVMRTYHMLLDRLGSEFEILNILDAEAIDRAGVPLLGEAIRRMRSKKIQIIPGYDGEFGKIKLFNPREYEELSGQKILFNTAIRETLGQEKHTIDRKQTENKKKMRSGKANGEENKEPDIYQAKKRDSKKEKRFSNRIAFNFLESLNQEQLRAVQYPGKALLISAGPGTGKTRTLTCRIAYLIINKRVSSEYILAVTFTNKAAREMELRLRTYIKEKNSMPLITTFHSLCFNILKENHKLKNIAFHGIIDDYDRKAFLLEAIKESKKQGFEVSKTMSEILGLIISTKQNALGPQDDLSNMVDASETEALSVVYGHYQRLLKMQGLFDYEDLLFEVLKFLEREEEIGKNYRYRFRHIFIDEYQDVNLLQYRIVRLLAPTDDLQKNICVIGDPNQSIYGFRGSDAGFFQKFVVDYPEAEVIHLEQNYRSSETILQASHQIIQEGGTTATRIFSGIQGVKKLSIIETATEKAEAVAVGKIIENLVGGLGFYSIEFDKTDGDSAKSRGFSDFAILYRTGVQSKAFEAAFQDAGIPFQIASKENLLQHRRVVQLVSLLKVAEGFGSYADLERIFGLIHGNREKKSFSYFKSWGYENNYTIYDAMFHARRLPIPTMNKRSQSALIKFFNEMKSLKSVLESMTVEQKISHLSSLPTIHASVNSLPEDSLQNILFFSKPFKSNAFDFVSALHLQTDTDVYDSKAEKVSLMTMHAAKGLEFPIVFVTGCEQGFLPFHKPGSKSDEEEERRLLYVSMTRAKDQIYITHAKKRRIYGQIRQREISPFITDIEEHLRQYESTRCMKKQKKKLVQLRLF